MKYLSDLTAEQVRRLFDYDTKSGLLTWRTRTPDMFKSSRGVSGRWGRSAEGHCALFNAQYAGQMAGCPATNGYLQVRIDGRAYSVSRVIHLWMTGDWPSDEVDHVDLAVTNNRWANLRPATDSEQQGNKALLRTNTSGFRGVSWSKKRQQWAVSLQTKPKSKWLGYFDYPAAAWIAHQIAADLHFGEFARIG